MVFLQKGHIYIACLAEMYCLFGRNVIFQESCLFLNAGLFLHGKYHSVFVCF